MSCTDNSNMERKDGRQPSQLSKILIQDNIKANCGSSIYIETPHLKLCCSITGPFYSSNKSEEASKLDISISVKIPSYYQTSQSSITQIENQLEDILIKHIIIDKYPRSKVIVLIEVFEYNCNYYPYAIMAVTLAINRANIEQKGLLTCSNCIISPKGTIISDPTIEEEQTAIAKLLFGCNISMKENFLYVQDGKCDKDTLKNAIATSIKICETYQNYLITKI